MDKNRISEGFKNLNNAYRKEARKIKRAEYIRSAVIGFASGAIVGGTYAYAKYLEAQKTSKKTNS